VDEDDKVSSLLDESHAVMKKFVKTITLIGSSGGLDEMIESCFDAYRKALGGGSTAGKFCRKWEQIISKKKPIPPTTNITVSVVQYFYLIEFDPSLSLKTNPVKFV